MRYTLADKSARPLDPDELGELLDKPNILRIAMIDARDSAPFVHPVWYYFDNGKFFLSVDRDGLKAQSMQKNPIVYFLIDIDPDDGPPRGVRGKGFALVIDDPEFAKKVTTRNVLRYLGSIDSKVAQKLIEKAMSSSVVEITPRYLATWKF